MTMTTFGGLNTPVAVFAAAMLHRLPVAVSRAVRRDPGAAGPRVGEAGAADGAGGVGRDGDGAHLLARTAFRGTCSATARRRSCRSRRSPAWSAVYGLSVLVALGQRRGGICAARASRRRWRVCGMVAADRPRAPRSGARRGSRAACADERRAARARRGAAGQHSAGSEVGSGDARRRSWSATST